LIDPVLVEKAMRSYESAVATALSFGMKMFLQEHRLGVRWGPDGFLQIQPRQVRIPDMSLISWDVALIIGFHVR
jgi:hypothetical protein